MSTLIVYPDAGSGAMTVDGYVERGTNGTWAQLRDGTGDTANKTDTSNRLGLNAFGSGNTWTTLRRLIWTFDTSPLTIDATVSAATLSLFGCTKFDSLGATPSVNIYSASPASNNNLVAGDFVNTGTTEYSTTITYASWVTGQNDFALNATGLAALSLSGISRFSSRTANVDVANVEPTWSASNSYTMNSASADTAGTTSDPTLTITYTLPSAPVSARPNVYTDFPKFILRRAV